MPDHENTARNNRIIFIVIGLALLFMFRLACGLCSEFWFDDERQIYLLGLKFFTTGAWPFFGPDVVYTQSQIPGALQALLVGLPLFVCSIPEAPFIFLNLLTFASLLLFSIYCSKMFPEIPKWFVYGWLLTAPWVVNYSTHVLNPCYLLPASIVFFICMCELIPALRIGFISKSWSAFLCGAAILWIFQLHMSWTILLPIMLAVFIIQYVDTKKLPFKLGLLFFSGCCVTGLLVLPTFIKYGLSQGLGGTGSNVVFQPHSLLNIFYIVPRFLSFASFELTRFLGPNDASRTGFLKHFIWTAPFIVIAGLIGAAQVIQMMFAFFRKDSSPRAKMLKGIVIGTMLVVYAMFFFSVKGPSSHTYYLLLPLAMLFFFYAVAPHFQKRYIRVLAIMLLVSGLVTNATIAVRNYSDRSLYTNRGIVVKAINQKDYHLLGERRSTKSGIGY